MKMVIGTITECVTNVVIKDTLLLTARDRDLRQEDAIIVKSKDTLPEIAQGNQVKD